MGMVALTFAAGITYYILKTGYIETNDGRNDVGYEAGDTYSSPAEQSWQIRGEARRASWET